MTGAIGEINKDGSTVIVKPKRDIVASVAQDMRAEFKAVLDEGATEVVVDMEGVEMMDSIGMGLLIAIHNSLTKGGGKLRVINAPKDILGLMRTMRLDKHFEILGA